MIPHILKIFNSSNLLSQLFLDKERKIKYNSNVLKKLICRRIEVVITDMTRNHDAP